MEVDGTHGCSSWENMWFQILVNLIPLYVASIFAYLGCLDGLMLVLPFVMYAGSPGISGCQNSFTSLHLLHLWFSFWFILTSTQILHQFLVYHRYISWVDRQPFGVEKSHPIPSQFPKFSFLNLPYFTHHLSVNGLSSLLTT